MLPCSFSFFYIHKHKKALLNNFKVLESFFSVIIANVLNKDQQYLIYILETKSIPRKVSENSGMVHFAEINHPPPHPQPYSMLQHNVVE